MQPIQHPFEDFPRDSRNHSRTVSPLGVVDTPGNELFELPPIENQLFSGQKDKKFNEEIKSIDSSVIRRKSTLLGKKAVDFESLIDTSFMKK